MGYDIYIGEAHISTTPHLEDHPKKLNRWRAWLKKLTPEQHALIATLMFAEDGEKVLADWISEWDMPGGTWRENLRVEVEKTEQWDAPSFQLDEYTGKSNGRHPGYAGWHAFCMNAQLEDLFFNKEQGLMRNHHGSSRLTQEHAGIIHQALKTVRVKHPKTEAIFGSEWGNTLCRLIWLDWWVKWALKNCRVPVLYNH